MLKNWPGVKIFTLIPTLSFGAKPVLTACGFVCVCSSYMCCAGTKKEVKYFDLVDDSVV